MDKFTICGTEYEYDDVRLAWGRAFDSAEADEVVAALTKATLAEVDNAAYRAEELAERKYARWLWRENGCDPDDLPPSPEDDDELFGPYVHKGLVCLWRPCFTDADLQWKAEQLARIETQERAPSRKQSAYEKRQDEARARIYARQAEARRAS